jgi:hypothetical protein
MNVRIATIIEIRNPNLKRCQNLLLLFVCAFEVSLMPKNIPKASITIFNSPLTAPEELGVWSPVK